MANPKDVSTAIQNRSTQLSPVARLQQVLNRVDIQERLKAILKDRAAAFSTSLMSVYNANTQLQACEPMSIVQAAVIAATLDLPINPSLGYAAIVPYGSSATFQIMWKGLVQLAQRTGQYKTMERAIIYEGELIEYNKITGETRIDTTKKKSDKVVGYVFYFRLNSGFEKYVYMTKEQALAHGKKFSKTFTNPKSPWQSNFDAMALKTVTKLGLGQWGPMSVEYQLQKAIQFDQAAVKGDLENPIPEYVDAKIVTENPDDMIGDAQEPSEETTAPAADEKPANGELPLQK